MHFRVYKFAAPCCKMNIVIVVAVTVAVNCFHWQARLKVTRTRDQRSAAASALARLRRRSNLRVLSIYGKTSAESSLNPLASVNLPNFFALFRQLRLPLQLVHRLRTRLKQVKTRQDQFIYVQTVLHGVLYPRLPELHGKWK